MGITRSPLPQNNGNLPLPFLVVIAQFSSWIIFVNDRTPIAWNLPITLPIVQIIDRMERGRRRRRTRQGLYPHRTAWGLFHTTLAENAGNCWPARPRYAPVVKQGVITPTNGAKGAPASRICAHMFNTRQQTGRRGGGG